MTLRAARESARSWGRAERCADRRWTWSEFLAAWNTARDWADSDIHRMPALDRRWHDRAAALGTAALVTTQAGKRASWIVAFPEAVALTAILTDLEMRRHIALGRPTALPADLRIHRRAALPAMGLPQRPGPQVDPHPPRQV